MLPYYGQYYDPGACFTNNHSITVQIWGLLEEMIIISLQTFAHAMTALLSCHVQNFGVITLLELGL